jgi:glucose/mannose-6-phosphate isomerase
LDNTVAGKTLDDIEFVRRLDSSHIFQLTEDFPKQCDQALQLAAAFDISLIDLSRCRQVVLAGVGGSAAAGDFLQALFNAAGKVPFAVHRDYSVPAWVDQDTLVLCSTYSGDTEETLAAHRDATSKGAQVLVLTSGGQLGSSSSESGEATILIPGGQPPRTALGWSFMLSVSVCRRLNLLDLDLEAPLAPFLEDASRTWRADHSTEGNLAKQLAMALNGKVPVIYGLGEWQFAVAKRWKAQINENAKRMAFANSFPEMNHNEILGWSGITEPECWAYVLLSGGEENAKMNARARITEEALPPSVAKLRANAIGETTLHKMLYLSLLGDFISLYLAILSGVDPGDISLLHHIKSELAAFGN